MVQILLNCYTMSYHLSLDWELICTSPSQYLSLLWPQRILCNMYVVVQFYPWLKFYFPLFQTQYHTLWYPTTKENQIWTKDKIEPQHAQWISLSIFITCWVDNNLKLWGVTVFQTTSAHSYKELTNKANKQGNGINLRLSLSSLLTSFLSSFTAEHSLGSFPFLKTIAQNIYVTQLFNPLTPKI